MATAESLASEVGQTVNLRDAFRRYRCILAEGAVVERLRRDPAVQLDRHVENASLLFDRPGRSAMEAIYREYLDIGQAHSLPMIVLTPTWRAGPARLAAAGLGDVAQVNAEGFQFLQRIRMDYGTYGPMVCIGGLMGCKGDAYAARQALSACDATAYHQTQARALCDCGVDFILAATLPALSEALGIAAACAECGIDYLLSFVIRRTGTLLDGTPLHQAVRRIDAAVNPRPFGYLINCVHPTVFAEAMAEAIQEWPDLRIRVLGLQANTSARSPEELNGQGNVNRAEDPDTFAERMIEVRKSFGLRILGGCCGTDDRHIRCIAARLGKTA